MEAQLRYEVRRVASHVGSCVAVMGVVLTVAMTSGGAALSDEVTMERKRWTPPAEVAAELERWKLEAQAEIAGEDGPLRSGDWQLVAAAARRVAKSGADGRGATAALLEALFKWEQ